VSFVCVFNGEDSDVGADHASSSMHVKVELNRKV
jgi:hypothetical protein